MIKTNNISKKEGEEEEEDHLDISPFLVWWTNEKKKKKKKKMRMRMMKKTNKGKNKKKKGYIWVFGIKGRDQPCFHFPSFFLPSNHTELPNHCPLLSPSPPTFCLPVCLSACLPTRLTNQSIQTPLHPNTRSLVLSRVYLLHGSTRGNQRRRITQAKRKCFLQLFFLHLCDFLPEQFCVFRLHLHARRVSI